MAFIRENDKFDKQFFYLYTVRINAHAHHLKGMFKKSIKTTRLSEIQRNYRKVTSNHFLQFLSKNSINSKDKAVKIHSIRKNILEYVIFFIKHNSMAKWHFLLRQTMTAFEMHTNNGKPFLVFFRSTLYLLVSSADNLCKQFGPRSGPTKCRA